MSSCYLTSQLFPYHVAKFVRSMFFIPLKMQEVSRDYFLALAKQ